MATEADNTEQAFDTILPIAEGSATRPYHYSFGKGEHGVENI